MSYLPGEFENVKLFGEARDRLGTRVVKVQIGYSRFANGLPKEGICACWLDGEDLLRVEAALCF